MNKTDLLTHHMFLFLRVNYYLAFVVNVKSFTNIAYKSRYNHYSDFNNFLKMIEKTFGQNLVEIYQTNNYVKQYQNMSQNTSLNIPAHFSQHSQVKTNRT